MHFDQSRGGPSVNDTVGIGDSPLLPRSVLLCSLPTLDRPAVSQWLGLLIVLAALFASRPAAAIETTSIASSRDGAFSKLIEGKEQRSADFNLNAAKLPARHLALQTPASSPEQQARDTPAPTRVASTNPRIVRVTFQPSASKDDIAEFLRDYKASILAGPANDGAYTLRLSDPVSSDEVPTLLDSMRSRRIIANALAEAATQAAAQTDVQSTSPWKERAGPVGPPPLGICPCVKTASDSRRKKLSLWSTCTGKVRLVVIASEQPARLPQDLIPSPGKKFAPLELSSHVVTELDMRGLRDVTLDIYSCPVHLESLPRGTASAPVVPSDRNSPASSAAVGSTEAMYVSVSFQPNISEADTQAFLQAYGIAGIEGPNAQGFYKLRLSGPLPPDQFKLFLDSMKSQIKIVKAAQPG